MKRLLLYFILLLASPLLAKDVTHPEFDMLDRDGDLISESGKPISNSTTCGACHDATQDIEDSSNYIDGRNIHPNVPLRDIYGKLVMESGESFSTSKSCGMCHDIQYIQSHSDHANAGFGKHSSGTKRHDWATGTGYFGAWSVYDYDVIDSDEDGPDAEAWLKRYGGRHVGGGPVAEMVEMNCLLCHTTATGTSKRNELLNEGEFEWVNSAIFIDIGLLTNQDDEWQWNKEKFNADGSVGKNLLPIRKPMDQNCGQCHGLVNNDLEQPLVMPKDSVDVRTSLLTGQIFSPQKLNLTGLDLVDKENLSRPFDVHSDRVISCVNCHYSLNNPAYSQRFDKERPIHVDFDPRRLNLSEYVQRPSHQFAKGKSSHGLSSTTDNSLRRCESCHNEQSIHDWLPYKERHFAAVACESCHIPELYSPTLMSIDWTLPDLEGKPNLTFRNGGNQSDASDNQISKFVPVLLPRDNVGGEKKLAPFNLVTGWFWLASDPEMPISKEDLLSAFTEDGAYRQGVLTVFDQNQDGQLSNIERRLDSEDKISALQSALIDAGVSSPRLSGEISAFSISHNVVNGKWASRNCQSCHHKESLIDASLMLSRYSPGDITPKFEAFQNADFGGTINKLDDGSIVFHADASTSGYYILGLDSVPLMDLIGRIMFFSVLLGVTVHATARRIASRRRGPIHRKYRKEYLYNPYERLWHWFQALSILILLATGAIINIPHFYSMFSFAYAVEVHNIIGFILFTNAALAVFYNLTSGEIKQYLPKPEGFFQRTVAQAIFYTKGIFRGDPHPLQKSRENRMNPIQQVTYLAILYLLLPTQIITGVLMWGLQRWPELTGNLGGLAILAPIHAIAAWAFAAFIIMHVYLTTTGHTHTAGIKSMITGWDHVHVEDQELESDNNN